MASVFVKDDEPTAFPRFMSVRQVADYLQLNEKKVYALVSEGKIPGTKITGKWMFPRELIDRWLVESSHGGLLTDRLIVTGSDDPLLYRLIIKLAAEMQSRSLISYTATGTKLGLELLARHRADVCAIHWGPVEESHNRHPALLKQHPQHNDWVLIRVCRREQGIMIRPGLLSEMDDIHQLLRRKLRWALRQNGAGSQRFLLDVLSRQNIEIDSLNQSAIAQSERDAAAHIVMGKADLAPGARSAATESGLGFLPIGWEAFDLALYRGIYFRKLFQALMQELGSKECQAMADKLGGYDFRELGEMVWAA